MTQLVTVVTPTIGRLSLKRAIASVMNQTIPARHVIVLDRPEKEVEVREMLRETVASSRVVYESDLISGTGVS